MKEQKFEDVLKELEIQVQKLESSDISLEDAIEAYKKGTELSIKCNKIFNELQETIVKKVEDGNVSDFNQE